MHGLSHAHFDHGILAKFVELLQLENTFLNFIYCDR